MPVLDRYSSALRATLRGSREYGCRVSGSCTKKLQVIVLRRRNGSTRAVVTSGNRVMSDSWIDWKPRMEEPSNAMPPASDFSVTVAAGTVRWFITPGRSQNRMSKTSTSLSEMYLTSSSVVENTHALLVVGGQPQSMDNLSQGRYNPSLHPGRRVLRTGRCPPRAVLNAPAPSPCLRHAKQVLLPPGLAQVSPELRGRMPRVEE